MNSIYEKLRPRRRYNRPPCFLNTITIGDVDFIIPKVIGPITEEVIFRDRAVRARRLLWRND